MSRFTPHRRIAAATALLAGAALGLTACSDGGTTLAVGDTALSSGAESLDERVLVPMPDGFYAVDALGVRDEAFSDGETVHPPRDAALVVVAVSGTLHGGEQAGGGVRAAVRAGDVEVPVELDARTHVVAVPGDGTDAELVLTYEGRSAVLGAAGADVLAAPFVETVPWSAAVDAPAEAPLGWRALPQAAFYVDLRTVSHLPDRGWAAAGETWVEARVVPRPGALLPVDDDDHDGVPVVGQITTAAVVVDGVELPLEAETLSGGGVDGGDAVLLIGSAPLDAASLRLRLDYSLAADGQVRLAQDGTYLGPDVELTPSTP